jgi:hypothetical protein
MYTYCSRHLNQLVDFDLPQDVRLFAGYVFPHSRNESPSLVSFDQAIRFILLNTLVRYSLPIHNVVKLSLLLSDQLQYVFVIKQPESENYQNILKRFLKSFFPPS